MREDRWNESWLGLEGASTGFAIFNGEKGPSDGATERSEQKVGGWENTKTWYHYTLFFVLPQRLYIDELYVFDR